MLFQGLSKSCSESSKSTRLGLIGLSWTFGVLHWGCEAIVPGYENKQQPGYASFFLGVVRAQSFPPAEPSSTKRPRLYLEDEEVPPLPTDALADDVLFPSNLPAFKSRL